MKIKPGDLVVTLENNIEKRAFEGRIGTVERIRPDYLYPYRVVGVLKGNVGIWCQARLATKLDKLLLGVGDGN